MRYALLRNRDGTPYQLMNAMAGMDLDDFFMLITSEAFHCQAAGISVVAEIIGQEEYDEIVAFDLADITHIVEL